MAGRKCDMVWNYIECLAQEGKTGKRARCKSCGYECQGLVKRMKKHYDRCSNEANNDSGEYFYSTPYSYSTLQICYRG